MLGTYLGRSSASQGLITDLRKDPVRTKCTGMSWAAAADWSRSIPINQIDQRAEGAELGQNLGRDDEASAHLLALDHYLQSACPFGHHPRLSEERKYSWRSYVNTGNRVDIGHVYSISRASCTSASACDGNRCFRGRSPRWQATVFRKRSEWFSQCRYVDVIPPFPHNTLESLNPALQSS